MKVHKKLEVERHNKEYEIRRQTELAYEIMQIEGLKVRDHEIVARRQRRARNNLAHIVAAGIGLGVIR